MTTILEPSTTTTILESSPTVGDAHAGSEPPGLLRAVTIGSAIGVVATFIAVAGALLLAGQQLSAALGIGGMSAFWGGLGFGSMLGGVTHLSRQE